jgi:regulator of sigma E protease
VSWLSWVLTIAGFASLIIIHEFGHFAAAKATGMRVERFFLFFPPRLFSVRRGETEYGIGALPFGGFVKITGMNPEEELPPDIAPRSYYRQPVWKRIVVIGAGPAMNLLLAFVLLFGLAFGIQEPTHEVGPVEAGSAAAARLQPGDRIVSVDGVRGSQLRIANQIAKHDCAGKDTSGCRATTPATVRIVRDGQPLTLQIRPRYDAELRRMRLGFAYDTRSVDPSPPEAARISADFMWRVSSQTLSAVARIFQPEERKQLSGVVGISAVGHQAVESGVRQALTLLAVISLSLALINLFPFLPLDGGHIFWSLVEKLRGRPVPFSVMERASVVGFLLVMVLFAVGLSNDIGRLTGGGFHPR